MESYSNRIRFYLMSRLWRNRLLWILNFKFLFHFSAFINEYCSSCLVIELCTGEVNQTDIYIYIYIYYIHMYNPVKFHLAGRPTMLNNTRLEQVNIYVYISKFNFIFLTILF